MDNIQQVMARKMELAKELAHLNQLYPEAAGMEEAPPLPTPVSFQQQEQPRVYTQAEADQAQMQASEDPGPVPTPVEATRAGAMAELQANDEWIHNYARSLEGGHTRPQDIPPSNMQPAPQAPVDTMQQMTRPQTAAPAVKAPVSTYPHQTMPRRPENPRYVPPPPPPVTPRPGGNLHSYPAGGPEDMQGMQSPVAPPEVVQQEIARRQARAMTKRAGQVMGGPAVSPERQANFDRAAFGRGPNMMRDQSPRPATPALPEDARAKAAEAIAASGGTEAQVLPLMGLVQGAKGLISRMAPKPKAPVAALPPGRGIPSPPAGTAANADKSAKMAKAVEKGSTQQAPTSNYTQYEKPAGPQTGLNLNKRAEGLRTQGAVNPKPVGPAKPTIASKARTTPPRKAAQEAKNKPAVKVEKEAPKYESTGGKKKGENTIAEHARKVPPKKQASFNKEMNDFRGRTQNGRGQ